MKLVEIRRAIRNLLDEQSPADALAVYYAYHHPENKSQIVPFPMDAGPGGALAYVAFSRTGMDLFRPFVTMRLPITDLDTCVDAIYGAMEPGASVILNAPAVYLPLLQALFEIQLVQSILVLMLDRDRFEPIINVLVSQEPSQNDLPRFVIRHNEQDGLNVVASATLNWQTPRFADVAVEVEAKYQRRGWGRSVLAAMVQYLIHSGRTPLYRAYHDNHASLELARRIGFADSPFQEVMVQGTLRPRP